MSQQQDARRSGKSESAFRIISEVARDLDVPQHVLRFWETKFSQIRPMKRGGGRRYYRPEDVELLRRIRRLLHDDGFTIKGVQKLLREGVDLSQAVGPAFLSPPLTALGEPSQGKQADKVPSPGAAAGHEQRRAAGGEGAPAPVGRDGVQPGVSSNDPISALERNLANRGLPETARAEIEDVIAELATVRDALASS